MINTNISKVKIDLNAVIPVQYQERKQYSNKNLQVIADGLKSPISKLQKPSGLISLNLFKIANDLGFNLDMNNSVTVSRIELCIDLVEFSYSHLSIEQLKHAFIMARLTEADLEKYGSDFNVIYLERVLRAYSNYIECVLPYIQKAEKITANRMRDSNKRKTAEQIRQEKQKVTQKRYYLGAITSIITHFVAIGQKEFDLQKVDSKLIKLLSDCGLVHFSKQEKVSMKDEAIELTKKALEIEFVHIEDERHLTVFQKAAKKRKISTLKELLEVQSFTSESKAKVKVQWCKIGLREWLLDKHLDLIDGNSKQSFLKAIDALKNILLTKFIEKGFLNDDDDIDLERIKKSISSKKPTK